MSQSPRAADPVAPDVIPNVWLVDQTRDFETYSNGLRIDDRYVKPNQKRIFYPVYQRGAIDAASRSGVRSRRASCITPPKAIRRASPPTKTPG